MTITKTHKGSIGHRYEINSNRQDINSIRYEMKLKLPAVDKKSIGHRQEINSVRQEINSTR